MFVKYVATYVFNCHKTTFLQMATSLAYICIYIYSQVH